MFRGQVLLVAAMLLVCGRAVSMAAQNPVYARAAKPQTVTVQILATSTSVHQGFAGRQETYLAEIVGKDGIVRHAKLVDIYALGRPILPSLLKDHRKLKM